ncbi:MAG: type I glutamate--ammonia ligase [Thermoplasmata archaeon HGW-Thermoplasmata-1]|nr:MAG: type I glutamate--ammonia ligase [Thermoplasmata archaeon HGW-Thermoplasmata-1]
MNMDHREATKTILTLEEANVHFVRLQFVDILGSPKNIVIPANRIEEAFDSGINFDASSIAGYATIDESDYVAMPDPKTLAILPEVLEKHKTAKVNCDIYEPGGKRYDGDTKYALEKVMKKAEDMGYVYNTGPECEFFLFKRDAEGRATMTPNDSAGYFDLSHRDLAEGVRGDISLALDEMGFSVYTAHHECAKGQHEINFHYADAVTTADRVITLKYVTKVIAAKHNLYASFMPKPVFGTAGSGMHVNQSLSTLDGENVFNDPASKDGLSKVAHNFIAGLLEHIKPMTGLLNPTVNSYKRLVPGYEAPTYIAWAHRNRSALIRIPSQRGKATRCELRSPDPSGNPYLQFAVMLAAGLDGIKRNLEPGEPEEKDIYSMTEDERKKRGIEHLPLNLGHSIVCLEGSELIKNTLGRHIFDNFLHVKNREWEDYRMQVTKWEMDRYFPVI